MKKYHYLILILVPVLILVGIFLLTEKISLSPHENCVIISENNGENKIDVVFLTDNVPENKAKEYYKYFLEIEPFVSNKEKFNFYYAEKSNCEIKDNNILFCYSKELIKKSSVCLNDYIVVLSDKPAGIRSSSYMNVMSINIKHPLSVFLHEFGHVFANLADEYVPSIIPLEAKNCQINCEAFEGIEGCFQGCSKESYYRSSEKSVMRSLSTNDYRKLNTLLIEANLKKYG